MIRFGGQLIQDYPIDTNWGNWESVGLNSFKPVDSNDAFSMDVECDAGASLTVLLDDIHVTPVQGNCR